MNQQANLPAALQVRAPLRLLVVAAGHVGNSVFCTPAIQLLRDALPTSTIDVVALNSASAEVFQGSEAISSVYIARNSWRMARLAVQYDEVICLHPKSTSLLKRVAVPVTVIPPFDAQRHHAEQILAFVSSLVGRSIDEEDRHYHLTPAASRPLNIGGSPRIGIHLGCGRTAIHGWKFFYRKRDSHPKLWPTEHYAALAEQLRQRYPDATFVITGTRNERFLARRFAKMMGGVIDLTGKTSIVELAGIIDELDLFITQDCGVLHVAAATTTPLLALFGPTCAASTGPWPPAPHHQILQGASMAEITPTMAACAAVELLQQRECAVQNIPAPDLKETLGKLIVTFVFWLQQYDFLGGSYIASSYAGLL